MAVEILWRIVLHPLDKCPNVNEAELLVFYIQRLHWKQILENVVK